MSEENQNEIARNILAALYDAWVHHLGISLNSLRDSEHWEKADFAFVIDRLKDRGFIKNGTSNSFRLTPAGIVHVEDNAMVPEAEIERHRELRTKALAFLEDFYQKNGSRAAANVDAIAEGCGVDSLFVDLSFLRDLGFIENASVTSYRITDDGRRHYRGADYEDII